MRSMVEGAPRPHKNSLYDGVRIAPHFDGGNMENVELQLPQPRIADFVTIGAAPVMRRTVDFDDEASVAAVEIDNVRIDRVLASELQTAGTHAQDLPETSLRR